MTEKGDYFSAMLYLIYCLFLAIIRVFRITNPFSKRILLSLGLIYFIIHVLKLTLWRYFLLIQLDRFDYTYNMIAAVIVGLCSQLLWVYWWIKQRHSRTYAWKAALLAICITGSMTLELFDFPPIG
jgi:hypothetical protein